MDRARSYSDAPDASVRIFGRESAGEMYEARFGCSVSSKFRGWPFAGRGSHIHNKPGLSVYHTGEEFASEPPIPPVTPVMSTWRAMFTLLPDADYEHTKWCESCL